MYYQGVPGNTGVRGFPGLQGSKGSKGSVGPPGLLGSPGQKGERVTTLLNCYSFELNIMIYVKKFLYKKSSRKELIF